MPKEIKCVNYICSPTALKTRRNVCKNYIYLRAKYFYCTEKKEKCGCLKNIWTWDTAGEKKGCKKLLHEELRRWGRWIIQQEKERKNERQNFTPTPW